MTYRFDAEFEKAVRIRGLTVSKVAELANVAPATASAAVRGHHVSLTSALRIARAVTSVPVIPELREWVGTPQPMGVAVGDQ